MINNLLFDIACRVPEKVIVFDSELYYLQSKTSKTIIPNELIQQLIEAEYVTKNKNGGVTVTNKAREFASTLSVYHKKMNEHHPGKTIEYFTFPEEFQGELYVPKTTKSILQSTSNQAM